MWSQDSANSLLVINLVFEDFLGLYEEEHLVVDVGERVEGAWTPHFSTALIVSQTISINFRCSHAHFSI